MKTARGDERQQVLRAQSDHLNMVMQWRTAQTRMNHLSEDALRPGRKDNQHELFKVDVDACDEAKFRVPRNTSNAKALEAVWRPQLHLHGALSWGVVECYWILEGDVFKDSSTEATIFSYAMDAAMGELKKRGTSLPHHGVLEVGCSKCYFQFCMGIIEHPSLLWSK
ncbi:unnamed protein product [Durusdinium trenchii]|uniref:Uncharacterized protein n=2 Tax=Durusdinium trenchii TaxID=1381693 RepID=A0ABP0HCY3_9DINO